MLSRASWAITMDYTSLASPAFYILLNNDGRIFTLGFSSSRSFSDSQFSLLHSSFFFKKFNVVRKQFPGVSYNFYRVMASP
ncbi:MAG: hypothetical protein FXF54_12790 [Kosmotoga sp.]|nr:MAG: hypothetical protein FXF54_12790 [Kosmotoga sp.]